MKKAVLVRKVKDVLISIVSSGTLVGNVCMTYCIHGFYGPTNETPAKLFGLEPGPS